MMDGLDDYLRFCPDESRLNFDPEDVQTFASSHFHSLLVAVLCLFAAFALSCLLKWRAYESEKSQFVSIVMADSAVKAQSTGKVTRRSNSAHQGWVLLLRMHPDGAGVTKRQLDLQQL
jgi:hypothetical protein